MISVIEIVLMLNTVLLHCYLMVTVFVMLDILGLLTTFSHSHIMDKLMRTVTAVLTVLSNSLMTEQ